MLYRYLPTGIFVIVVAAGIWMAAILHSADRTALDNRFEVVADDAADRVQQRIMEQISFLKAAHSFFVAEKGQIDREVFADFVTGLDLPKRYEGIGGIGYAPYITPNSERAVAERIGTAYNAEVTVWPETTDQDMRAPIAMIEPIDLLRQGALGYDAFADPERRLAMVGAIATGQASATAPVKLVQSIGADEPGVLVYFPLRPQTDDETPAPVTGFVFGGFYTGYLHNSTLRRAPRLPVSVRTLDVTNGGAIPVYQSPDFEQIETTSEFALERSISIAGRDWQMTVLATPEFGSTSQSIGTYTLAAVSLLLAFALAASAHAQLKALEAARRLHENSEKSIQDKDMMLQEMKHRIKNSIARVLAIARQTASHSDSLDDFSTAFMSRMQAMARAQDMLTRSSWQRADLNELLTTELEQVFGDAAKNYVTPGDPVELSERATQALGLVFHELATNALKYGGVAEAENGLRISWAVAPGTADGQIVIDWRETSAEPVEAPADTGFGTRLISANVEGELGGTVDRTFTSTGLHVRITIPKSGIA